MIMRHAPEARRASPRNSHPMRCYWNLLQRRSGSWVAVEQWLSEMWRAMYHLCLVPGLRQQARGFRQLGLGVQKGVRRKRLAKMRKRTDPLAVLNVCLFSSLHHDRIGVHWSL